MSKWKKSRSADKATKNSPAETTTSAPLSTEPEVITEAVRDGRREHNLPEPEAASDLVPVAESSHREELDVTAASALTHPPASTKRLSALDAAAQVLTETKQPLNCQELIGAMAVQGLWSSPNGKTPAATLYSAIIREIATRGRDARFKKTGRGTFAAN